MFINLGNKSENLVAERHAFGLRNGRIDIGLALLNLLDLVLQLRILFLKALYLILQRIDFIPDLIKQPVKLLIMWTVVRKQILIIRIVISLKISYPVP